MIHHIESQWMGKMQFNALVNGHTIIMDAPERVGGEDTGPIPKPFVLTALSGCTGMDIISILRKKGIQLDDFQVDVDGTISKQAPIVYTSIHIIYRFKGNPDYINEALEAVSLSQEAYCGVSAMLKKIMPVTWEVLYNHQTILQTKATFATESVAN